MADKTKISMISTGILILIGVILIFVYSNDDVKNSSEAESTNDKQEEMEAKIEKEFQEKFPFYDELLTKEEMEEVVSGYKENNPEITDSEIKEKLEMEHGEINKYAYQTALLIDKDMDMFDREQILAELNEEIPVKSISNPIASGDADIEEKNRFQTLDELSHLIFEDESFYADTNGFITNNGLNLGYPVLDGWFEPSDEHLRSVSLQLHYLVDEDVPLEDYEDFYYKLTNNFDVSINGHDLTETYEDIFIDGLKENPKEVSKEIMMEYKEQGKNYIATRNTIIQLDMEIPLEMLVDVPQRQFPTDGYIPEFFPLTTQSPGVVVNINGEEFTLEFEYDDHNPVTINPEIR
ncbi:MAG TPA: hypothetical protein VK142_07640 [Bacillota bacterium]|nr:hypothetical protein [Bacillota bacterium]